MFSLPFLISIKGTFFILFFAFVIFSLWLLAIQGRISRLFSVVMHSDKLRKKWELIVDEVISKRTKLGKTWNRIEMQVHVIKSEKLHFYIYIRVSNHLLLKLIWEVTYNTLYHEVGLFEEILKNSVHKAGA